MSVGAGEQQRWQRRQRAGQQHFDDRQQRDRAGQGTHPVAQKAANGWALYDMLGNV